MLKESFIASTLNPEKPSNSTAVGIHVHEFQPIPALKSTFKKSSTNANCLAVGPSHVFAAQADKAVIQVYNRGRNNQEAVVPFPEKIHSIALVGGSDRAVTLVLGTEGGRVILWEVCISILHSTEIAVTLIEYSSLELADKSPLYSIISSRRHAWLWTPHPTSCYLALRTLRCMSGLSPVFCHSRPPITTAKIRRPLPYDHFPIIELQLLLLCSVTVPAATTLQSRLLWMIHA